MRTRASGPAVGLVAAAVLIVMPPGSAAARTRPRRRDSLRDTTAVMPMPPVRDIQRGGQRRYR